MYANTCPRIPLVITFCVLLQEISSFIPEARQFTDAVRTFAYGTDASFYRLNPKMVVKVHSEEEVARIMPIAAKHKVPITFRAAGTSLSGQAITDSVLLKLSHTGKNFRNFHIPVRLPWTCLLVNNQGHCGSIWKIHFDVSFILLSSYGASFPRPPLHVLSLAFKTWYVVVFHLSTRTIITVRLALNVEYHPDAVEHRYSIIFSSLWFHHMCCS